VLARAQTAGYRLRKYLSRHWAGVAAVLAIAIALIAVAVTSWRAARLAQMQQARSARVTQFLEDMLGSADPGWEGTAPKAGSQSRMLDLLPVARERIATVFASDPAAQARLHRVIGRAYTNLHQFPDAEVEMKAAIRLLPALQNDPAEKSRVLLAAGDLDFLLSHHAEEERELRQALEIFEHTAAMAADPAEHAIYISHLAAALADVGGKKEAEQDADRAARLIADIRPPSPVRTGIIHYNLELIYMKLGRLEPARSEGRLATAQLSLSPRPLNELAQAWMWLGITERLLGDPAAAREAAARSVQVANLAVGAGQPLTVAPRIELAYTQALSGDMRQAIPELTQCLAQAREASSDEDLFHALHSMGYVLTLAGRAREGEPLLREAIQVGGRFLGPGGPSMGVCDFELAQCLDRQGHAKAALDFYRTAYNNLLSYYGPVDITLQAKKGLDAVSALK
jgi:serine/threonine-protein kinase